MYNIMGKIMSCGVQIPYAIQNTLPTTAGPPLCFLYFFPFFLCFLKKKSIK